MKLQQMYNSSTKAFIYVFVCLFVFLICRLEQVIFRHLNDSQFRYQHILALPTGLLNSVQWLSYNRNFILQQHLWKAYYKSCQRHFKPKILMKIVQHFCSVKGYYQYIATVWFYGKIWKQKKSRCWSIPFLPQTGNYIFRSVLDVTYHTTMKWTGVQAAAVLQHAAQTFTGKPLSK